MLQFALPFAAAAELMATLDGAPFVVKTALAQPDPKRPWVWGVLVSDAAYTCEDLASVKAADDTRLMVMFGSSTPGTPAAFLVPTGAQGVDLVLERRSITVGSVPTAAGPGGTLQVDLAGPRLAMRGSLPFELCAPLGARPAIAWGTEARRFTLRNAGHGDGDRDKKLKVVMTLPETWAYAPPDAEVYQFDSRWTAPDAITVFAVTLEAPPADFASEAARLAKDTIDAWVSLGAVVRRNEAVGAGAWVFEYGPTATRTIEVLRYEAGWRQLVHCTVVSDNEGADAIFADMVAACVGLRPR